MRAAAVIFVCLCLKTISSQVAPRPGGIAAEQYSVTVEQPVYAGEPIWIHTKPEGKIHYPFRTGIGDLGCNRLELMHDGKLVPPRRLPIGGVPGGLACGSVAPPNAPADRLPLHILFPSLMPGTYAVRWISQMPESSLGRFQIVDAAASDWTTFQVKAARGQGEEWLQKMLTSVPSDPGLLAGDYIPNLAGAAPDGRALHAIAELLYSPNEAVAWLAASALQVFPEEQVDALLVELIHVRGPSEVLANLVSAEPFRKYRAQMVTDCIRSLHSGESDRITAAIKSLQFLVHSGPNTDPSSPVLASAADAAVLGSASAIIASGQAETESQLAQYLGILKKPQARELLWQIASAGGSAAEQARIAIAWNALPEDLQPLAAILVHPGDSDPTGRDLSSIPYALVRSYGVAATPSLEKALADSPYVSVRTQSAEELVRHNNPAALRFFIDAISSHRFYKDEMTRFLKDTFPSDLRSNADDAAVVAFLTNRLQSEESKQR